MQRELRSSYRKVLTPPFPEICDDGDEVLKVENASIKCLCIGKQFLHEEHKVQNFTILL